MNEALQRIQNCIKTEKSHFNQVQIVLHKEIIQSFKCINIYVYYYIQKVGSQKGAQLRILN